MNAEEYLDRVKKLDAMIDHARGDTTDHWLFVRIAELKKKYQEGEPNG